MTRAYAIQRIEEMGYKISCIYINPKYKKCVVAVKGQERIVGSISSIYRQIFGYN